MGIVYEVTVSDLQDEKVLGMFHNNVNILNVLNCTLKMVKMVNFHVFCYKRKSR